MLSQQDTDKRCPRKQSRKPYEGSWRVLGEMLTSTDRGAPLKTHRTPLPPSPPPTPARCRAWRSLCTCALHLSNRSCEPQLLASRDSGSGSRSRGGIAQVLIKDAAVLAPLTPSSLLGLAAVIRRVTAAPSSQGFGLSLREPAGPAPRRRSDNREFSMAEAWSQAALQCENSAGEDKALSQQTGVE